MTDEGGRIDRLMAGDGLYCAECSIESTYLVVAVCVTVKRELEEHIVHAI